MVNVKDANAMAEVLYYLKGIRQEDVNKIPKKFMQYLNENASKEYKCNFDYNKPLKDLELADETRGIIGMICYNYWCIDEAQKKQYIERLTENDKTYQKILYEKYNPDNIFDNKKEEQIKPNQEIIDLVEYKESIFKKIINRIKGMFK